MASCHIPRYCEFAPRFLASVTSGFQSTRECDATKLYQHGRSHRKTTMFLARDGSALPLNPRTIDSNTHLPTFTMTRFHIIRIYLWWAAVVNRVLIEPLSVGTSVCQQSTHTWRLVKSKTTAAVARSLGDSVLLCTLYY